MAKVTQQRLKELLHYDPETGIFVWSSRRAGVRLGAVAGSLSVWKHTPKPYSYRQIRVDRRFYRASHIAHLYMTGEHPAAQIDHKNGDGSDDRWANLRPATQSQNQANTSTYRNNKCGFRGVYFVEGHSRRPWRAMIQKDLRRISLGYFQTPNEAFLAHKRAAVELFGEFARLDGRA